MASTHHHTEETPRLGNGNDFDPFLEWFGIPPDEHSFYTVLGVDPSESDDTTIKAAAADRQKYLERHLDGPHAAVAQKIKQIVEDAKQCLLDPKKRKQYDDKIRRKRPELLISHRKTEVHDTLEDIFVPGGAPQEPGEGERQETIPQGTLSRMASWTKKNPVTTAIGAGTLIVASAVSGVLWKRISSADAPAAVEQKLSDDAPELTQRSPLPPAPPPVVIQPKPEPSVPAPTPAGEAPVEPKPSAPPKAEEPPAPAAPSPATEATEKPATAEPASPARSAAPTPEQLEPYSDLLRSPTLAKQTTEQLIEQVQRSNNRTEQWVLLRIALKNARSERNLDRVMTVLSEMQKRFTIDDAVAEDSMAAVREAAQQKGGNVEQVMTGASSVIRGMCARDDFAEAKKFVSWLKDRPSANRQECLDILRVVSQLQKAYDGQGIGDHQETLTKNPDDPEANKAVGTYRCFAQGDWSYTSALRASNDPILRDLADRVDGRDTLTAEELLKLAKDLLALRPGGPGATAMAVHCLELAEPKSGSALLTARIKDMQGGYGHLSSMAFFRGTQLRPPSATSTKAEDIRVDVPGALPPGAVNLMGEDPKGLLQRGQVIRVNWKAVKEGETDLLQGTSGHHSWIASVALPLAPESQKIVQSGQYTCRFVFKRTSDGRRDDSIQGATACIVPLPNGQSIGLLWDGNMEQRPGKPYRSGFDSAGTSFFSERRGASAFDHPRPIVTENGLEYVCLVTVRTAPGGYLIDAQIAGRNDRKPIAKLALAAPPTLRCDSYLLEEGNKRFPAQLGAPWGMGVGGGTIILREAQILPSKTGSPRSAEKTLPLEPGEHRTLQQILPSGPGSRRSVR